jgi:hypothetical protein
VAPKGGWPETLLLQLTVHPLTITSAHTTRQKHRNWSPYFQIRFHHDPHNHKLRPPQNTLDPSAQGPLLQDVLR